MPDNISKGEVKLPAALKLDPILSSLAGRSSIISDHVELKQPLKRAMLGLTYGEQGFMQSHLLDCWLKMYKQLRQLHRPGQILELTCINGVSSTFCVRCDILKASVFHLLQMLYQNVKCT